MSSHIDVSPATTGGLPSFASAPRRSAMAYVGHALAHPANLVFISFVALVGLFERSLWAIPVTLVVEALLLLAVVWVPFVRRGVERGMEETERFRRQQHRQALLARMYDDHWHELIELERLVRELRSRADPGQPDLDEVERLLGMYAAVAIAYRTARDALPDINTLRLQRDIRHIEAELRASPGGRAEAMCRHRLRIAHCRLRAVSRHEENLRAALQTLAAIADLLRLIYERSVAGVDVAAAADELMEAIASFDDGEHARKELDEWLAAGSWSQLAAGEPH